MADICLLLTHGRRYWNRFWNC